MPHTTDEACSTSFARVPNELLTKRTFFGLSDAELCVVLALHSLRYAGRFDLPRPKIATLAEMTGRSVAAARRAIRSLKEKGLLLTTRRMRHNEYDLAPLFEKVLALREGSSLLPEWHRMNDTPGRLQPANRCAVWESWSPGCSSQDRHNPYRRQGSRQYSVHRP